MTNYRLRMNTLDLQQFKVCFSCGAPIEHRPDLEQDQSGETVWGCSARNFDLLIWVTTDEKQEPEFI